MTPDRLQLSEFPRRSRGSASNLSARVSPFIQACNSPADWGKPCMQMYVNWSLWPHYYAHISTDELNLSSNSLSRHLQLERRCMCAHAFFHWTHAYWLMTKVWAEQTLWDIGPCDERWQLQLQTQFRRRAAAACGDEHDQNAKCCRTFNRLKEMFLFFVLNVCSFKKLAVVLTTETALV